jgi:hypothetical protein
MIRAAGVHLMWSGEWGWEVSLAIEAPGRPPGQSRRVGRCGSTVRIRLGLPSLRATGAPKDAEINQ